jgi:hypothetical protein
VNLGILFLREALALRCRLGLRMPSHVESRADLPIRRLVASFLEETQVEDPRLFKALSTLDDEGTRNLAGVLGRFDAQGVGVLEAEERLKARRILVRLRRPSTSSLALLNRVLDYLDLNGNGLLDGREVRLTDQVIETFQTTESKNDSLSDRELELLYAVLRGLDRDHDGRLSRAEQLRLQEMVAERR